MQRFTQQMAMACGPSSAPSTVRSFVFGLCLATGATSGLCAQAYADGLAFAVDTIAVGEQPNGLAAIDVDGDGDDDIAVVLRAPARLQMLVNTGGRFSLGQSVDLPATPGANSIAAADLDLDGATDLAITLSGNNKIQYLRNVGGLLQDSGTTNSAPAGPFVKESVFLDARDADGDGIPDLTWAVRLPGEPAPYAHYVAFAKGIGNFQFAVQWTYQFLQINWVQFIDWDGRGTLEIAQAEGYLAPPEESSSVNVLKIMPNGTLELYMIDKLPFFHPEGLAVADLDQNGLEDMAVAYASSENIVRVFLAEGGLNYELRGPFSTEGQGTSVVRTGRLDCDDQFDLAVLNTLSNNMSLFMGDGTGEFNGPTLVPTGQAPTAVLVGDLDGIGREDLAVANFGSGTVTVYRNADCLRIPEDLTGDGLVDGKDLGTLLGAWGTPLADLNGDGTTDGEDLSQLLAAWS